MSGDFIERLVDGQLLSRMTELEAELAAERATNGRLRAAGDALDAALDYELGCPCNDENPYDEMYGRSLLARQKWEEACHV